MKIVAVGDLIGESGLNKAKETVAELKETENIDFIIVNGENVADGMGIMLKHFNNILSIGTNVVTMGNHTWAKKDIFSFIDHEQLIRPANYPEGVPGKGYAIFECKDKKIAVINLIGRTEMGILTENPFIIGKKLVEDLKKEVDIVIVDFHAEATAEKVAMGNYLDGIATIVYGTHTHVQTSDDRILPNGTAYLTDIGMTGPKNSVIGMDIDASLKRFVTTLPERYKMAEGECIFNGCIFDINDENCQVKNITRLYL